MLPSSLGVAASRAATAGGLTAGAMDQMLTARQPWSEYMRVATRADAEPYPSELNPPPMYRGRKRGMEGWLFKEQVQLHYKRYPDEHVLANLQRWRDGDTVEDVALQQFRGAQPFLLGTDDELGFKTPAPEEYFKLNYKNPMTLSKYLTRTGQYYPLTVQPMNPEARMMLRRGVDIARRLGLYPYLGNPFWHRVQRDRPKAYQGEYDPVRAGVKRSLQEFSYNWLQLYRARKALTGRAFSSAAAASDGVSERAQQTGFEVKGRPGTESRYTADVGYSPKTATVPGLLTLKGMRRNPHLYASSSKRRMGFPNPVATSKKL